LWKLLCGKAREIGYPGGIVISGVPDHLPLRADADIAPSQWAKVDQVVEWARKNAADRLASYQKAAWEACSWGLFQVLGCNYDLAGYPDVVQFKAAMESGEDAQLRAGLAFMDHKGLIPALRARDWRRFTLGYNGDGQVDDYVHWLTSAYARFV